MNIVKIVYSAIVSTFLLTMVTPTLANEALTFNPSRVIEEFKQNHQPVSIEEYTLQQAEGITQYFVYAVESTNGGVDYIDGETLTPSVHSGDISVIVLQYGYGNDNGATLNAVAPNTTNSTPICGVFPNVYNCSAGQTITGWLLIYDFYNSQGGYFTSSATSIAQPFGTHSTFINIQ